MLSRAFYDALTQPSSTRRASARMVGLASQRGEATITFDPYGTVGSRLHPDVFRQARAHHADRMGTVGACRPSACVNVAGGSYSGLSRPDGAAGLTR